LRRETEIDVEAIIPLLEGEMEVNEKEKFYGNFKITK
jgi:hypothetical protein